MGETGLVEEWDAVGIRLVAVAGPTFRFLSTGRYDMRYQHSGVTVDLSVGELSS